MQPSPAEHLKPYLWQKGQSGNPAGKKPRHPITDALVKLFEKRPELAEAFAKRIVVMAAKDAAFLREVLNRLEGPVARDERRELPSVLFHVQGELMSRQPVRQEPPDAEGTSLPGSDGAVSSPEKNGHHKNGAQAVEVEALPLDEGHDAISDLEADIKDDGHDNDFESAGFHRA